MSTRQGASVGIVGGGILGTVLSLRLAQAGARVTVLERGPALGGLATAMDFGGHVVDRFYHVIVPSDGHMIAMAEELGLGDQLRFSPVEAGFFIDGKLYDLNDVSDFMRFKPLTPVQRLRLAWFVAQCQLRRGYDRLDHVPVERWLRRQCGAGVTDRIWRPLLDSRFDSDIDGLPATYIWARTKRMSSARRGGEQREEMGHMVGGHQRLIDAMGERARELGVEVELGAGVSGLSIGDDGAVDGVEVDGEARPFDLTIATVQPPALRFLLPQSMHGLLAPYPDRYLGVVCVVLKVPRSLSPYYAVNICDPTPITTVVETSHVVGTDHTGGMRLIYLPKYCDPDASEQSEDEVSLYERFTDYLSRLSPGFSRDEVVDWTMQRAKLVEPVHKLGAGGRIAPVWPGVRGLALACNAQIYPRQLNGNSVMEFAERVAGEARERLRL